MPAVGIICEYNPFHEGHKYHIQRARELSGADTVVAVMNGDFVQRGEPAVVDKYTRAEMALAEGADMVFELPVRYGLSSAEDFAYGGILALNSLCFVNSFCFGSEVSDISRLLAAGEFFAGEPDCYKTELARELKKGTVYPAAREHAYLRCTGQRKTVGLFEPNSTLGIEYIKAAKQLHSRMQPFVIERKGMGYHETVSSFERENGFLSATAIRENMKQGIYQGIPSEALTIFRKSGVFLEAEDFWRVCSYAIRQRLYSLEQIKDISGELAAVFSNNWYDAVSFQDFVTRCKTKNITMSRVKRCVFQTLIGLEKNQEKSRETVLPYIRLLGMKKEAAGYLKQVEKTVVLGRLAKDREKLTENTKMKLEQDIFAADIYRSVAMEKSGKFMPEEYKRPVLVR